MAKKQHILASLRKAEQNIFVPSGLATGVFEELPKTLDLGHLDIEYEWYLRKMKEGGSVPNKYVNEAKVNFDSESEPFDPSLYESQIIAKFLN